MQKYWWIHAQYKSKKKNYFYFLQFHIKNYHVLQMLVIFFVIHKWYGSILKIENKLIILINYFVNKYNQSAYFFKYFLNILK